MTPAEERNERIDRLIEFLANNQAQMSAQQASLMADIQSLKEIAATHTTQIVQLTDALLSLARIVEDQGRRTDERFRATDERFRATEERFRATDERLNLLIGVVERYFSNGRKE